MTEPTTLIELQAVHDNLQTIQRDLSNLPPDMSALAQELASLDKRLATAARALAEAQSRRNALEEELKVAQKSEDAARASVKTSTQKVHYAAAIRDLDERERQRAGIQRPLKEVQTRVETIERDTLHMQERRAVVQTEFDGLQTVFLSEHENQVAARTLLETRKKELEAALEPSMLVQFDKLIHSRQGRAVVPMEDGNCTGCRTKLRMPFLAQLREDGSLACESCLRILYTPRK
jgi:uncharacterized protein